MANPVYSVTEELTVRNPESIQLGRETYTHVPVINIVEAIDGITLLNLLLAIP